MSGPAISLFLAAEAPVSTAPLTEHQVLIFLVQVILLVGVARLLGGAMRWIGQPPVVGELLAGVVLGPSLFGLLLPGLHESVFGAEPVVNSVVFGVAWLGVILLLVVLGFETDLDIIARFRRVALTTAFGSLLVPLLATGVLGYFLASSLAGTADPPPWVFGGFFALALSVSALPVVGKILADLGYLRRNFGQITLAAAMTKDAVGWLVLAVLTGVALDGVQMERILISFGGLALFGILAFTLGVALLDRLFRFSLSRGAGVGAGFSMAVVAALIGGAITQALHVEAILGAYIVGLVLARTRHQLPQVRERLEMVTAAFFAPLFFAVSGLRVDITVLADVQTALWAAVSIALAMIAQFLGALVSARIVGVELREAVALGSGLSPLGIVGVVVAIIGLNVGIINETAYTILLLAAVFTSLVAPLLLRAAVDRLVPEPEEADRLERESLRDEAEILGVTRVLLPTRGGSNSVYAARIVASVFEDAEVTILAIGVPDDSSGLRPRRPRGGSSDPQPVVDALEETSVQVLERTAADPAEAIVEESRLGYDLLVMGASRGEEGAMVSTVVERVLRETQIQTMIVQLPDARRVPPTLPRDVLVPVTATRSSRAAEELGYSIAGVSGGRAVALHVVNRPDGDGVFLPGGSVDSGRRTAEGLMDEAREFAGRLGVEIETEVRVGPNAEQEILDFAINEEMDLVVLGTSSRPLTDRPFFGHRISYMVENSPLPIAIVALPSFRGANK